MFPKSLLPIQALFVSLFVGVTQVPAGTLTGSFDPVAAGSNVDLTTIGKLDWVHWGFYTDTSVDRKGSVAPMISSFTLVSDPNSYVTVFQYADNLNGYSWYDGAP